jgi:chemotaxis receptor (MCP) glutamine deamidase CheD
MKRCLPILGLGCCVGAVLLDDEKPCEPYVAPSGRSVQRCVPMHGLGCCVSAVFLDEKSRLRPLSRVERGRTRAWMGKDTVFR